VKSGSKKRILAQLYLQTRAASSKEASERIQALEQEVDNIEGKLARQGTNVGQARRALGIRVGQVQAVIPRDAALVEYVSNQPDLVGVTTRKCQNCRFERTQIGQSKAFSVNSRRLSGWKTTRRASGRRSKLKSVRFIV